MILLAKLLGLVAHSKNSWRPTAAVIRTFAISTSTNQLQRKTQNRHLGLRVRQGSTVTPNIREICKIVSRTVMFDEFTVVSVTSVSYTHLDVYKRQG